MANKSPLIYYGELKVTDGKYMTKDGQEKTRYITVGKLYHSPHMSRVSIYMNPTATSEGKWVNAYPHEDYKKPKEEVGKEVAPDQVYEDNGEPITLDDIPF